MTVVRSIPSRVVYFTVIHFSRCKSAVLLAHVRNGGGRIALPTTTQIAQGALAVGHITYSQRVRLT